LRVRDEKKIPFFYVTHNAGEAAVLAREAVLLQAGRIRAIGAVKDVLRPAALSSADPDASFENVFAGTLEAIEPAGSTAILRISDEARLLVPRPVGVAAGARAVFGVSPDDVLVSTRALERSSVSARNVFAGQMIGLEPIGPDTLARILAEGVEWRAKLTAAAVEELALSTGKPIWIAIKTHAFRRLR
jgi:molybdate transport system ATP-binding protein